jgi:DNA replication and repair protein RecF
MHLTRLYLRNFRNYDEALVSFSPSVNLITGGNAQGKTNLLEALYFLSTGRSFRTARLEHLIRSGASFFYLEAHGIKQGVSHVIKATFDGQTRKVHHNGTTYASFAYLIGILPSVLHAPEDAALIAGAPQERRKFLDIALSQSDPLYLERLSRFHKAMRQRNLLLKEQKESLLSSWEEPMAEAAAYVATKRRELTSALASHLQASMRALSSGKELLEASYQSSLPSEEPDPAAFYLRQFHRQRPRELALGVTVTGPHRDDLLLTLDQRDARLFSSEGQKRCAVAALRLAEWKRQEGRLGFSPLLFIDDFGIHLDRERSLLLQQQLAGLGQVFLTSPRFLEHALSKPHLLHVAQGTVTPGGADTPDPEETASRQAPSPVFSDRIDRSS